jgi:hypothetical protein
MSKPSAQKIKGMMEKLNTLTIKVGEVKREFDALCENYYGPENYSDNDLDSIIDCLDYGNGKMSWKEFDMLMKEINSVIE